MHPKIAFEVSDQKINFSASLEKVVLSKAYFPRLLTTLLKSTAVFDSFPQFNRGCAQ